MDPFQIRQALVEVRNLRKSILEKQLFKGYSGRARAAGGCIALLAALLMQYAFPQAGGHGMFLAWAIVFVLAVLFNYGAVVAWLLKGGNRKTADLGYLLEVVPVWLVGGILTLALWRQGQADLLYGSWMCLFGLAQSVARSRLPRQMCWVGLYYIVAGSICLALPIGSFSLPMVMGLVFFIGEWSAGIIMHSSGEPGGLLAFFKFGK